MKKIDIRICQAYAGGVNCEVFIDEKKHLIDINRLELYLQDKVRKGEFILSEEKYAKLPRIILR